MVDPSNPTLVGEVKLSPLVSDCATFAYVPQWWNFPMSEDLPIIQGQAFSAGLRGSAPGAIDDARTGREGERIIRHIDRPARLSILEMLLFSGDDRYGALGTIWLRLGFDGYYALAPAFDVVPTLQNLGYQSLSVGAKGAESTH